MELSEYIPGIKHMPMYNEIVYGYHDAEFVYFYVASPFSFEELAGFSRKHPIDAVSCGAVLVLPIYGDPLPVVSGRKDLHAYKIRIPLVLIGGRFGLHLSPLIFDVMGFKAGTEFKPNTTHELYTHPTFYTIKFSCEDCQHSFSVCALNLGEIFVNLYKAVCELCFRTDLTLLDIAPHTVPIIKPKTEEVEESQFLNLDYYG